MSKNSRFLCVVVALLSTPIAYAELDCQHPTLNPAPIVDRSLFFPRVMEPAEMQTHFDDYQKSGKRFEYRGYIENGQYLVPFLDQNMTGQKIEHVVAMPETFTKGVRTHLAVAFKKGYANFPYLPDMGHGHFLIPDVDYARISANKNLTASQKYEEILKVKDLKVLYHAAELLKYADGGKVVPGLEFLRENRNIVGSFVNPEDIQTHQTNSIENTIGGIPGHATVSNFYFSISPRGCLPATYKNQELALDFSIVGPSYVPNPNGEYEEN